MLANFACPHCESTLQMDVGHTGGSVRCPACGQVFMIAAPEIPTATLVQPPQQQQQQQQARPQAPQAQAPGRPIGRPSQPQRPAAGQPQRPSAAQQQHYTASRQASAADTESEERKAKLTLAAIAVTAFALIGVVGHFVMKWVAKADVTGLSQVANAQAEREKAAVREQRTAEEKAAEEAKAEKEQKHIALRDYLAQGACRGNVEVADALATALEETEAAFMEAFNNGALPPDVPAFMTKTLEKKLAASPVLRSWLGPISPGQFAQAIMGGMRSRPPTAGGDGVGPGLFASGKYSAMGTAFHVSGEGWLITNHHVVRNATEVDIRTASGDMHIARVVTTDPENDLALLKTSAVSAEWLPLSNGEAKLGAGVFTIGFPRPELQGIEPKFTEGTVSSLKGLQDTETNYQISVPVQPGNSGGALVHMQSGWVVGVVRSVLGGSGVQNVNYAVKSKTLRSFLESTEAKGILNLAAPPNLTDPAAIIEKAKSATVLVLIRAGS